jgi:GTP-binding protein
MGEWTVRLAATAFRPDQFPQGTAAEVAVAGRSNVGKSSLINGLLGTSLAKVAGTPGKTRSVNFYDVRFDDRAFRLVDLPGYGYASRSKEERRTWSRLIDSYLTGRDNMVMVLHLVDFRHGLLANDRTLQDWIAGLGIPLFVVFTKGDKITKGSHRGTLEKYIRSGLRSVDVPIVTSAEKGTGIPELRRFLERSICGDGPEER